MSAVLAEVVSSSSWQAHLQLGFVHRLGKTLLAQRRHLGPLTVQRPFYPEGEVCHVYLLHPPGGVVGGDQLKIDIASAAQSHALVTTPAAGKFYRSHGLEAHQTVTINVANGALLEWLPQETIIYEGAQVRSLVKVELAAGARFIGWDILSFGRPASGEGFTHGYMDTRWQIHLGAQPLLLERLRIDAEAFAARWGLNGQSSCGTLLAYPASADSLIAVQQLIGATPYLGVTRLDNLLVCRAVDARSDRLRTFFEQVWAVLRPEVAKRPVCSPRIWAT